MPQIEKLTADSWSQPQKPLKTSGKNFEKSQKFVPVKIVKYQFFCGRASFEPYGASNVENFTKEVENMVRQPHINKKNFMAIRSTNRCEKLLNILWTTILPTDKSTSRLFWVLHRLKSIFDNEKAVSHSFFRGSDKLKKFFLNKMKIFSIVFSTVSFLV